MPIDAHRITQLRMSRRGLAVGAAGAVASLTGAAVVASQAGGHGHPDPTQPSLAMTASCTVTIRDTDQRMADGVATLLDGALPT